MKRLAAALAMLAAACGSGAPEPVATGPLLRAEKAASFRDSAARLWNSASGAPLATLADHEEAVVGLAWSADGNWLASGDDGMVTLWKLRTGTR